MTMRLLVTLSSLSFAALAGVSVCNCSSGDPEGPVQMPASFVDGSAPPVSTTLSTMEKLAACATSAADGQLLVGLSSTQATINGPARFVDAVQALATDASTECQGEEGFGQTFDVSWGDDPGKTRTDLGSEPMAGVGCVDPPRHLYSVPGTYVADAKLYGGTIGGSDQQSVAWSGSSLVQVPGTPPAATTLDILPNAGGPTLYYQGGQDGFHLAWSWSPTKALGIEAALVTDDGSTFASQVSCPAGYVGNGTLMIGLAGADLDAQLAKGPISVRPRIRLYDGQTQVLETIGEALTYTAQLDAALGAPTVTATGTNHAVTVSYYSSFPTCTSYSVDWGDGSTPTVQDVTPPSGGCVLGSDGQPSVTIAHTYAAAGTYSVQVKTSEVDPTARITDIVPYSLVQVTVP